MFQMMNDIKLLLSDVAEDVVVDNFSLDVDEDLPEGRKAKIREAQKIITDKTAFVKLKKSYTTDRAIDVAKSIEDVKNADVETKLKEETVAVNDTYVGQQWYLDNINVSDAWDAVKNANNAVGVRVAVIDSGIELTHPDLSGRILKNLSADLSNDNLILLKNKEVSYSGNHGTVVAGAAAAIADNNLGIAGVAGIVSNKNSFKSKILAIQTDYGDKNIAMCIRYAVSKGADVINLSMGKMSSDDPELVNAINFAYEAGVTVVASAGNSGKNTDIERHYPSSEEHVISVMFTNPDNTRNWQSNYGKIYNDICAPGHDIITTDVNNQYTVTGGSSLAAPIVAGTVAMMKGVNEDLQPDQIEAIIKSTAYDIGETGVDDDTASGLVNTGLAVQKAKWYTIKDKQPVINAMTSIISGKVSFYFKTVGNEERYNVYRSTSLNGVYKQVGNGKVDASGKIYFTDNNAKSGVKYFYKVWVKTKYGDTYKHSAYSNAVSCVAK